MPRKDSSWIEASGLYGTWTFSTETMTDVGYYKGTAYVVMHLMPDPMQVKSCALGNGGSTEGKSCREADNKACSHGGASGDEREECVDTETSSLEWSDVTAFFQFGFRLREGIVKKSYHTINTSDWLGPYNLILAPIEKNHFQLTSASENVQHVHTTKELFVSRYVNTPWTSTQLQRPFTTASIFNFDETVLETVAGTIAINATIHEQIKWRGGTNDDPYDRYSKTCAHGDLNPLLPRIQIEKTVTQKSAEAPSKTSYSMAVDYSMLSVPVHGIDDLYKKWPSFKRHLGDKFPLNGPYCYGKDPNRAFAIRLSYDSTESNTTSIWKGTKGCRASFPCWEGDASGTAAPSARIPTDNNSPGAYVLDPMGLEFALLYGMGFLLVVSLLFNCQLANRLRSRQVLPEPSRQPRPAWSGPGDPAASGSGSGRRRNSTGNNPSRNELEEPLLDNTDASAGDEELLATSFDNPPSASQVEHGVEGSTEEGV